MLRGYLRVSTDKQRENTSIAEQERKLRALAEMRGEAIELYIDDGVSGSIPLKDRPAGSKLVGVLEKGDIICAAKLDRAFRSSLDAITLVDQFHKTGIKVILLDMGAEPLDESAVGKFFFTILAAAADFDRARIRERMMEGSRAKKAKGGHTGGEAPYGYRVKGSSRNAILVPSEEEQKIVQAILDAYHVEGSYQGAADKLAEWGVRSRAGGPIFRNQVRRIVNRQPIGVLERQHLGA